MIPMHVGQRLLVVCAALGFASAASAEDSIWSAGVGTVLPTDELVSCAYAASSANGTYTVAARFQKRASDGTVLADPYVDANTKLKVKMQCHDATTGVYSSPASAASATFADTATISCPSNTVGKFVDSRIQPPW